MKVDLKLFAAKGVKGEVPVQETSKKDEKPEVNPEVKSEQPKEKTIDLSITDFVKRMQEESVKGNPVPAAGDEGDYEILSNEFFDLYKRVNFHADSVELPKQLATLIKLAQDILKVAPEKEKPQWQARLEELQTLLDEVSPKPESKAAGEDRGVVKGEEVKADGIFTSDKINVETFKSKRDDFMTRLRAYTEGSATDIRVLSPKELIARAMELLDMIELLSPLLEELGGAEQCRFEIFEAMRNAGLDLPRS